jgi:hypothetical protein
VGEAQVLARKPLPLAVGGEELVHLGDVGARLRVAGGDPADELEVADVARRDAIVVALAVAGEHLERPRPDAGDRAQPAPAGHRVLGVEVDAAGGELGRDGAQGERARRREVHRGEQRMPSLAIINRWIAIARWNSINCSVMAAASVSHGSGLRRIRSSGTARTALPMTGSSRNAS